MPAYRFCRPDDIPLLVRAVNECYNVHFPGLEPLTVEAYRAEMKELSVWPSNSMVALAGDDPIAVLIGTKRQHEILIIRLGVRPDHLRQGHGGHLVNSLSQKLAVLGPPRLIAEVPLDPPGVADFFAAAGYRREAIYVDWTRAAAPAEPVPEGLVIPITVDELADGGLLEIADGVAWERTRESLAGCRAELDGLAIATPERIEAFVLSRQRPRSVDVLAAGCRDGERREVFLGLLLRALIGGGAGPVRLPRLGEGELPAALLESLGFEQSRRHGLFSAVASPA